ncbi:MAG: hypothetical protein ACOY90_19755 [Candidatus Zhuqueibacterota bacterium]
MFTYFKKCIFCFNALPETPTGDGEHVIPKNIYGFWRVYDICDSCRQYFGDKIDQLSIKNAWILKALHQLDIPEYEKYSENLPYVGKDTIDGKPVEMIRKNKKYKNKVRQIDDKFFECSEDDWKHIGQEWIRSTNKSNIDDDVLNNEIRKLNQNYDTAKLGEIVESDKLNVKIRKRQVKDIKLAIEKLPPITPLIAKIASFFLIYALPPRIISNLLEIESLVNHARYDTKIREYFINWCPLLIKEEYQKRHTIRMHNSDHLLVLDISLFGYPNWRIFLHCKQKIKFDPFDAIEYDTLIFILDFENPDNKRKIIGFKAINDKDYKFFNAQI